MTRDGPAVYDSIVPFDNARIGAAAIYCSDGRFGEQFDDFLQRVLGLPRYDRLAIPGGPACLAGHFASYRAEDAAVEELGFLVEVHDLRRVILIAHHNCAFYTQRLGASELALVEMQRQDLAKATERVREISPRLVVERWFAHLENEVVCFEEVE